MPANNDDSSLNTAHRIDRRALSRILSGRAHAPDAQSFSPADWDHLVHLALAEGVAPLVYWALSNSGELASLPGSLANALRAMYFAARLNNEEIIPELETLARLFAGAGIPVVALKGVCYALTIYPDASLRPMADLDLLLPACKVSEAVRIARASGYAEAVPEAAPGLKDLLSHHVCLKKTVAPFTTLELHDCLVANRSARYAVPVDWFWSQTEPIPGPGAPGKLLMLTPTAQVLYACAHAMLQHGGRNTALRWVYDLDQLIRAYAARMDWSLLLSQAREFQWSSAVEAALSRTVFFFDTPVPPDMLPDICAQPDRNAERVAAMQDQPASHTLEEYQKLKSLHGHGRFKLTLALAVPSPTYMRWRYGVKTSWALPAWYLYRWWVVFMDAIRTASHLLRKALKQFE